MTWGKKSHLEELQKKGLQQGREDGIMLGEFEKCGRWLGEGHGPGICSKMNKRRKGHES